jgi:hypothetical protein
MLHHLSTLGFSQRLLRECRKQVRIRMNFSGSMTSALQPRLHDFWYVLHGF